MAMGDAAALVNSVLGSSVFWSNLLGAATAFPLARIFRCIQSR